MESALELCPPGPFSVCRLGDSLRSLGLGLHLSLAASRSRGDEPSVLGELALEIGDLLAQVADHFVGQQAGPFQFGAWDAPLSAPHDGLDRAAIGSGAHRASETRRLGGFA
jgi:hypothetical protein